MFGIIILAGFYFFFFAKIVVQSKHSIKTNQMGIGNKPQKVIMIEKMVSLSTALAVVADILSIFIVKSVMPDIIRTIGIIIGVLSVIIFASAIITMKDSWRAGIPEKKTSIVTNGIYSISRNPAFLSFDMLYLSILLMFFNIPLLLCTIWAVIMFHIQILQEEKWLAETFGDEYTEYFSKVRRYLGRKHK